MKNYHIKYSEALNLGSGEILDDFSCPWKEEEIPATRFCAVWNRQSLKFKFEVEDHDLVLGDDPDPGQAALGSDRVELFFASSTDLRTPYYGAEMAPSGNVYDYEALYHRKFSDEWSFKTLSHSGSFHEGGYTVVGIISLEELEQLGCLTDSEMIAGVYRAEFSHGDGDEIIQEWICWIDPKTEVPDFHVPASFGKFILDRE